MSSATRRCLGLLDKLAAIAHDRQMSVARQDKSSECFNHGDRRAAGTSVPTGREEWDLKTLVGLATDRCHASSGGFECHQHWPLNRK